MAAGGELDSLRERSCCTWESRRADLLDDTRRRLAHASDLRGSTRVGAQWRKVSLQERWHRLAVAHARWHVDQSIAVEYSPVHHTDVVAGRECLGILLAGQLTRRDIRVERHEWAQWHAADAG